MRIQAALLLPALALLASCATTTTTAPADPNCKLATVPAGAVFGVRHGMDTATWPPQMARGATGCQRVWYGSRQRPEAMEVLATYYFDQGHVRRLVGRVPGGATYDCHYREGDLDRSRSQNPGQCPKASEVQPPN